ncbi:hypothetical protein CASFOL_020891 [Castilleja foliolosa]|uniref:protein-disulfide reductase n=1 Tax=Castilleja foliolosa TaxID=1961234 RepID=A0ABD3D3I6_9LAMI
MERPSNGEEFDLSSILGHPNRDYLIRNNGEQVKIDSLKGRTVGLYFSASWCGPCKMVTPKLIDVYNELLQKDNKIEIVFVSKDKDDEAFGAYFSEMPWLAVPFSDSETIKQLNSLFSVKGIPSLVFLDEDGKLSTAMGVPIIMEHGAEGYPFTSEQIKKLKEQEIEAKRNQSLKSLLVFGSRDYVIAADGKKVPVSELQGKTVGLYFIAADYTRCLDFNPKLVALYKSLRENSVYDFEIVMIPLYKDETSFGQVFEHLPWLSLPVNDKLCTKLVRYFELDELPTVVVIGPDGKTLHSNVVEAIEEHGVKAYPFTPENYAEIEKVERAKREAQTLESILVSNDCDFVVGKDGVKIPVSSLVGKNILLYFSAHWCPPCRAFLPKLIQTYQEINKTENPLEVIFISSDQDQKSFDEFFATMPWLAIPFGDSRKESLSRLFKIRSIPTVIAIGPDGKTVSTEARYLIMSHGPKAYPFTAERVEELDREDDKMAEGLPEKVKVEKLHDHELTLTKRQAYVCDGCGEQGRVWSYYCKDCDFDLHLNCWLKEKNEKNEEEKGEGWVCDGDKCYKEE